MCGGGGGCRLNNENSHPPKDNHIPVGRICKYVPLYGKRDCADIKKVGRCCGLNRWAQCSHWDPYKREAEVSEA